MRTTVRSIPILALAILSAFLATAGQAARPLKVSDFGSLQAAIDAARDGDTILVDQDTPGARVDRKLIIRGDSGRGTGGLITGTMIGGVSTGLDMTTDASGSELVNLKIRAEVGIASLRRSHPYEAGPASGVTVRNCRIEASAFGFYLLNHYELGHGGWTIEHNLIELKGATRYFGRWYGVALSAHWDDTRVAHNKIFGTKPAGDRPGGGVVVVASSNVEIVQNEIMVNIEDSESWADAVLLFGGTIPTANDPYVPVSNVTVSMNDLRGAMSGRGTFGVLYWGPLDESSDRTGLGAFDHIPVDDGIPGSFAIGGNLSTGSSNRGELSGSEVGIDDLIHP
jgi:hypothetical protein